MTSEELQELLNSTCAKLSEHFDSIQIVATIVLPTGSTDWKASGSGDWYARRSACQEFIERDQAMTVARTNKAISEEE